MWCRGKTKGVFNKLISYFDSSLSDHGILRVCWGSWGELPGKMYRCNQPFPFQIKKYVKKYKIRSIINLRGERACSSYFLEKDYCIKNKIKLYNYPISSRDAPSKEKILSFFELINKIKYPALMHCKSGADRVGLASTLYLINKHKMNVEEASKQLSLKHLHIKYAKTGILDYFFEIAIKKGKNLPDDFMLWIKNEYNQKKLKSSFKSNSIINLVTEIILKRE